jgi:hypothetical protein
MYELQSDILGLGKYTQSKSGSSSYMLEVITKIGKTKLYDLKIK